MGSEHYSPLTSDFLDFGICAAEPLLPAANGWKLHEKHPEEGKVREATKRLFMVGRSQMCG